MLDRHVYVVVCPLSRSLLQNMFFARQDVKVDFSFYRHDGSFKVSVVTVDTVRFICFVR